ncbi:MAG: hypothetical protein RIE24_00935 [Silicimonas sp.]
MFKSSADVFRIRQVVSDLTTYIATEGWNALTRVSTGKAEFAHLCSVFERQGGCFVLPDDHKVYGDVLLAAALPDDDFPAFTCATAFLLLDRIQLGGGDDSLYWNWDAFSDHYRLSDPAVRALLLNGFRTAARTGLVSISSLPTPAECFTEAPEAVLGALREEGHERLISAIADEAVPRAAGEVWIELSENLPSKAVLAGVRHLYERPQSIEPASPEIAPLIPWSL